MPSNISRRTVAKGAAWTVPVVAVGAAAPAMAASLRCPTVTITAVAVRGGVSAQLRIDAAAGYSVKSIAPWSPSRRVLRYSPSSGDFTDGIFSTDGFGPNPGNDYSGTYTARVVLTGPDGTDCPPQSVSYIAR
jgi:hypothetical protein